MTEPVQEITLEEVRARFLEADTRLSEAAAAIAAIEQAAERMGVAHDGVVAAGAQLAELASSMGAIASSLNDNATHLREGVDAIRAGGSCRVERRIEELDASFTAMQSVTVERFSKLESGLDERLTALEQASKADNEASARRLASLRQESRILGAIVAILVIGSIILAFVR